MRQSRSCRLTLLLAGPLLLASSGCAAIKATEQPNKKNFNVLARGTPRTHVIAEFGAPTWSDERPGAVTDVFAFRQGYTKEVKAGRALFHGAADVATIGLWEVVGIPAETLIDGTEVQVSIAYDETQRVESIDVIKGEKVINPPRWFGLKRSKEDQPDGQLDAPESPATELPPDPVAAPPE